MANYMVKVYDPAGAVIYTMEVHRPLVEGNARTVLGRAAVAIMECCATTLLWKSESKEDKI